MIETVVTKGGYKVAKVKCEHPERRPADGKCSKELIEKCHGKEEHKCEDKK